MRGAGTGGAAGGAGAVTGRRTKDSSIAGLPGRHPTEMDFLQLETPEAGAHHEVAAVLKDIDLTSERRYGRSAQTGQPAIGVTTSFFFRSSSH